jgi:hypothetical protein
VHEYVACAACRLDTHSTRYTQYLYNTQVGGCSGLACSSCTTADARYLD